MDTPVILSMARRISAATNQVPACGYSAASPGNKPAGIFPFSEKIMSATSILIQDKPAAADAMQSQVRNFGRDFKAVSCNSIVC